MRIALSGGFDPIHIGHLRMIKDASVFGEVVILLNSDKWLVRKKGYAFQPFEERKEMLEAIKGVSCVLPAMDSDNTVCESIKNLNEVINYFGNGGDRGNANTPEALVCEEYGIPIIYGLGGNKIQSSSKLVTQAIASGA